MVDRDPWTRVRFGSVALVALVLTPANLGAADRPTTTPEIIEMLEGEISEEVIAKKIEVDGCDCMVSPELLKALQTAGASEALVSRLIDISAEAHAESLVTTPMIIEMFAAEISEELIWRNVIAAGCDCDTSAQSLISLKRSGASEEFMASLIEIGAGEPRPSGEEPAR